ncbi:hypothetical protein GHT06_012835 [Daphnia sinensis]|uniref:Uncharacterized protein n=1 Tax=Daphnia sinensis TaxID=1820382 RepID=A0AAD5LQ27_9CRUS|nr:hypothetical protein GHT06_012835 [Daphnia sinensis]
MMRAYLMEEREAEKTLSLFGRLSWLPLSLSRSRTQPLEEESTGDVPLQLAGPFS